MPLSKPDLIRRKRAAVEARIAGASLRRAAALSGLSQPTVIAAYRAWQARGWDGLKSAAGGRPAGSGMSIPQAHWQRLCAAIAAAAPSACGLSELLWNHAAVKQWLEANQLPIPPQRTLHRYLKALGLVGVEDPTQTAPGWWRQRVYAQIKGRARALRGGLLWLDECPLPAELASGERSGGLLRAIDSRRSVYCLAWRGSLREAQLVDFLQRLTQAHPGRLLLVLGHPVWLGEGALSEWLNRAAPRVLSYRLPDQQGAGLARQPRPAQIARTPPASALPGPQRSGFGPLLKQLMAEPSVANPDYARRSDQGRTLAMDHLDRLEAESIHIFREVLAEAERPVLLYSIGKDSAVLLHLALKAFYPARLPFPLLHVDTTWKFKAMYAHRDQLVQRLGLQLISYTNPEGLAKGVNPFTHGANVHTDIMKTQALKQALDLHHFDVAFGGARRDEEKSRAKERVLSFRNAQHRWDPKNQRPELWRLYNGRKRRGESLRAFPLSNWTEADVWQYIQREGIELVPLYLAAERPVVERDGALIMVDDERMPLRDGEVPVLRRVRFRTLGCYPLTGAIESAADTLEAVVAETLGARSSERQGRVIDQDPSASMERKKQEGYF